MYIRGGSQNDFVDKFSVKILLKWLNLFRYGDPPQSYYWLKKGKSGAMLKNMLSFLEQMPQNVLYFQENSVSIL